MADGEQGAKRQPQCTEVALTSGQATTQNKSDTFPGGNALLSVRLYQPSREALFLEVSLEGRPELCFRRKKHCINCKPQLSNPIEYHRSHLTPTSDSSYINLTPTQPQLRGQKVDPPKHPESVKPKTDSLGKFPDLPT